MNRDVQIVLRLLLAMWFLVFILGNVGSDVALGWSHAFTNMECSAGMASIVVGTAVLLAGAIFWVLKPLRNED